MKTRLRYALLLLSALIVSCEQRDNTDFPEIKREYRRVEPLQYFTRIDAKKIEEMNSKLETVYFTVPPSIFQLYPSGGVAADPFAPEPINDNVRISVQTAEELFESAGVTFGDGTSAFYNPKTRILKVVQTPEQLSLITAFFESIKYDGGIRRIFVRVEAYSLKSAHALKILESASRQGDHTPERNAALEAVSKGLGEIAIYSVLTLSAQRALSGLQDEKGDSKPKIGLLVDSILGGDNTTIDINLHLKMESSINGNPKELMTNFSIYDGDYALIGNWMESEGRATVVFVTANTQQFDDMYIEVEGEIAEDPKE